MTAFTFYADPSHAWLKVDRADALALGFTARDFSRYSYVQDGGTLYLEEDCDAGKFLRAWEAKHGRTATTVSRYSNSPSFIRRLRRNGQ